MKVLLKSAKLIDSASPFHNQNVDILISDGVIEEVGKTINSKGVDKEIDYPDLHVSPGWFDSSVSFGEPGFEERETIENGLFTAAKSGFTAIALNPGTYPVIDDNGSVTSIISKAHSHSVKLHPIGALTRNSQGVDLAELYDMYQGGAVAFGDYKKPVMNPNLLKLALQYTQSFNGLVMSFPQDNNIAGKGVVSEDEISTQLGLRGIAPLAEELQIARDLAILRYTGGKLHIPGISTEESVNLIRKAKKEGLDVSCSVAVHNLIFSDKMLLEFNTNAKVLPPLRNTKSIKALIKGVKDGTVDLITSDHYPVDVEHKKVEFEHALYGTIGLESFFGALITILPLEEAIAFLTKGRERFGIPTPVIQQGNPANLTLFTPFGKYKFTRQEIYSSSENSLFLDTELKGKVYGIISGEHHELTE